MVDLVDLVCMEHIRSLLCTEFLWQNPHREAPILNFLPHTATPARTAREDPHRPA